MKYTTSWLRLASEKNRLSIMNYILMMLLLAAVSVIVYQATKKPLIIERSCFSRVIDYSSDTSDFQKKEVNGFLTKALLTRFNSGSKMSTELLSVKEATRRDLDFKELEKRKISQTLLVREVTPLEKIGFFKINADRILSVGELRSAFRYPLIVQVVKTKRTQSNPYGMLVKEISPLEKIEKLKKKSKKGGKKR